MAMFNNYYYYFPIWVAFFVAIATTSTIAAMDESVHQYAQHVGSHCGKEVFDKVLYHYNTSISLDCCYKLVQMGHPCYTKLVKGVLEAKFRNRRANWGKIVAKSDTVFHTCDVVTSPGDPKFLANCHASLSSRCGDKLHEGLVHYENFPKRCCEKLVKTGLACHEGMVKELIRTDAALRNANASEALIQGEIIFSDCQQVDEERDYHDNND